MFTSPITRFRTICATALLALSLAACGSTPANSQSAAASTTVPVTVVASTNTPAAVATNVPATAQAAAPAASTVARLNLNTATANDFLTVPGVGNNMVREFLEYRPYTSIQQFRREIGKYVSADQVAAYEKYVYVPIDVNQADAATLQQIPGLDATEAAQLIAGRPYASNDAFLAKLAAFVSQADLAAAPGLLSAK